MNPSVLAGIDNQAKTAFPGLRSVLVVRGGDLVVERYYHGSTADEYHHVFSVTKSVTSALVGIALGDHRLKSLHQTVGALGRHRSRHRLTSASDLERPLDDASSRSAVGGVALDRAGALDRAAPPVPPTLVADHPILPGQG